MEKYLDNLGEDRIIKRLSRRFSKPHPRLLKAIGDDTSVTLEETGKALLATTDILIEGTHFKKDLTPPRLLGKKALSISLSDIAAMGGTPLFFLVSIALPGKTEKTFLDELYKGLSIRSKEYGAILAGGNTARSKEIMVSTTVLGEAARKEVVYRSGARPGNLIYLTGTAGDSALGLKLLLENGVKAVKGPFKKAVLRHLDPAPRVEAGRMLAKGRIATSMIDASDGVALDIKRLCAESRVGAVIEGEKVPVSAELKRYFKNSPTAAAELALSGGEDYELIFTAPEKDSRKIGALAKGLNLRITRIGRIVKGKGIRISGPGGAQIRLKRLGFEHF